MVVLEEVIATLLFGSRLNSLLTIVHEYKVSTRNSSTFFDGSESHGPSNLIGQLDRSLMSYKSEQSSKADFFICMTCAVRVIT